MTSFTNGGSTVYSEACSGPASFVISLYVYQKLLEEVKLQKLQCF